MRITTLIVLPVFTLIACHGALTLAEPDWAVVHTQGKVHFVVVNKSNGWDKAEYRRAMASVCPPGKDCQALFWRRGDNVPSSVPLSYTNFSSVMAFYAVNTDTRQSSLRWNCREFEPTIEAGCLDEAYVDGVLQP